MATEAPKIDLRMANDIARTLSDKFAAGFKGDSQDPFARALINIFARYAEIIIQRLNRTPQKNFLAFLDLLGASLLPPQPARVPLTFSLAAGSAVDGIVPAGTQVAAPPGEGETDPIVYETERELVVTAAQLDALFVRDPEQDRYSDLSSLLSIPAVAGKPLFDGEIPIDHILYVGEQDFFGLHNLTSVKLELTFDRVVKDEMVIEWDRWDGTGWTEIAKLPTDTNNEKQTFELGRLDPIDPSPVAGKEGRWVRGRLRTPITLSTVTQAGKVRAGQLPITIIEESKLSGKVGGEVAVEHSFGNQLPLDTSTTFFPFGDKPKPGDSWLIAQNEAFSQAGAKVTLSIFLADTVTNGNAQLKWEYWNGKSWKGLTGTEGEPQAGQVQDGTKNLAQDGKVVLWLPEASVSKEINGVEGSWLRVRLASGNYGKEAEYEKRIFDNKEYYVVVKAPSFKPPIISSLAISYEGDKSSVSPVMLAYNDLVFDSPVDGRLKPFHEVDETRPTFYLGFTLPQESRFPQRAVSLYFRLIEPLFGQAIAAEDGRPELAWEYWNGAHWNKLPVNDGSAELSRPGLIEFLPPADFSRREEFGLDRYWLRVRWEKGEFRFKPKAQQLLLNTTMAVQAVTLSNEVLGSSMGGKGQKFRATQTPILDGPRLEVREPELPSAAEQRTIEEEEGKDAITIVPEAAGQPREIWVRWHEVADFYGSQPRDRHYVLDHLTGEIGFGDGLNGLIPPPGVGNLRLAQYRAGGGRAGNRPAGTIVQLRTTVPYVDRVTNHEAATGGADAESIESLIDRSPRTIRHNYRAVTVEDFEDVARLASPEVARAKCVPLRNLIDDPLDRNVPIDPLTNPPTPGLRGHVSLIIVPRGTVPKPLPSLELIQRVQEHLDSYSAPTARVWVTGPLYLRVDVKVEVALVLIEGAGAVEQAIQQRLAAFLHPLTGGLDGKGWDFGREPHLSDLYALIEAVPGVDHITRLQLTEAVDAGDGASVEAVKKTGRFLVYSGAHKVDLKFEEE